jgi:hypothetical protein
MSSSFPSQPPPPSLQHFLTHVFQAEYRVLPSPSLSPPRVVAAPHRFNLLSLGVPFWCFLYLPLVFFLYWFVSFSFFFTFEFSPLIHVFRCVYCFCSASLTLKVVAPLPMMMVFSAREAYEREEEGVLRK